MATGVKTYQVDIASNPSVIKVTAEPIANNITEVFPVAEVINVTPVYFDYTSPASPETLAISAYTAGPNSMTVPGNFENEILPGDIVVISGSTNNDGNYTVVSAVNSGADTVITVVEAIIAAPVDGDSTFTILSGTVEPGQSGDSLRATYPYKRMTRVIIETNNGKKLDLELQSITNHATWSTGNKLGLAQAIADIGALL